MPTRPRPLWLLSLLLPQAAWADPDGAFGGDPALEQLLPDAGSWVVERRGGEVVVVPLGAVLDREEAPDDGPPVSVLVDRITLDLDPGEVSALTWTVELQALEPAWVEPALFLPEGVVTSARLDGRAVRLGLSEEVPATSAPVRLSAGRHRLVFTGLMPTPQAKAKVAWTGLPPAARARLRVGGEGLDVDVEGGLERPDGSFDLVPANGVVLTWKPEAPPPPRPGFVGCEAATALRVDEGSVALRSRLRWRVVHQPVTELRLRLPGQLQDLEVLGSAVASHSLSGDTLIVALHEPTEGAVDIELRGRAALPADGKLASLPVPQPQTTTAAAESWVSLLRGDADTVVPEPQANLEAASSRDLPDWATGLLDGSPVSTYRTTGGRPALQASVLRFEPAETPPTFVDEARYVVSYTADGGVAMNARYQVRNDRSQYLRVTLPEGWRALGVRVTGEVVQPVRTVDEAGRTVLFVPLEKSVLALSGLVQFPVDLALWGREEDWALRGERRLQTPALDAPIALATWEVHLPGAATAREVEGPGEVVENWADGSTVIPLGYAWVPDQGLVDLTELDGADLDDDGDYDRDVVDEIVVQESRGRRSMVPAFGGRGKASEPVEPAKGQAVTTASSSVASSRAQRKQADEAQLKANQAYRAYQDNRFDEAERLANEALELDVGNVAASSLSGNISMLRGDTGGGKDDAQSRRIRELAYARSSDKEAAQAEALAAAEKAERAGNEEEALRRLEEAWAIAEELSVLEQQESYEQKALVAELEGKLSGKKKTGSGTSASGSSFATGASPPQGGGTVTITGGTGRAGLRERANRELVIEGIVEKPEVTVVLVPTEETPLSSAPPPPPPPPAAAAPASKPRPSEPARGRRLAAPEPEPQPALEAEAPPEEDRVVVYKQRTEIDFEGLDIAGELVKPDGNLVLDRKKAQMSPLIGTEDLSRNVGGDLGVAELSLGDEELLESEEEILGFSGHGMGSAGFAAQAQGRVGGEIIVLEGGVAGGVQGGVVGGVAGGSLSGAAANENVYLDEDGTPDTGDDFRGDEASGAYSTDLEAYDSDDIDVETSTRGETLSADFLERVPAGRAYQQSMQLRVETELVVDVVGGTAPAAGERELTRGPDPDPAWHFFPRQPGANVPDMDHDGWSGPETRALAPEHLHVDPVELDFLTKDPPTWRPPDHPFPVSHDADHPFPVSHDADLRFPTSGTPPGGWPAPAAPPADPVFPGLSLGPDPQFPGVAASADPVRPPPPPPAERPLGLLDVPAAVDGAQLTLNPPPTGSVVRIEQRLVPAHAPLTASLRYRLGRLVAEPPEG